MPTSSNNIIIHLRLNAEKKAFIKQIFSKYQTAMDLLLIKATRCQSRSTSAMLIIKKFIRIAETSADVRQRRDVNRDRSSRVSRDEDEDEQWDWQVLKRATFLRTCAPAIHVEHIAARSATSAEWECDQDRHIDFNAFSLINLSAGHVSAWV